MASVFKPVHRIATHPLTLPFYAPSLLFGICLGLLKPILPLYALDFTASYALVGVIVASDALGTVLGDIPAGILLRRYRDKTIMLVGLGLVILSMVLLSLAESVVLVILLLFAFGAGRALFNVATHVYIGEFVRTGNRGRAISLLGGIHRIGNATGPVIGGFVAAAFGLRAPFLLFAIICGCGLAIIVLFLKSLGTPELATAGGHQFSVSGTLKTNSRSFITAGSGQLFAQMIRAGRNIIIPLYAADVLGLDEQAIGIIVSVSWALDMTLFYPAGWIMDNLGRKFAIVPSFIIQAVAIAIIPLTTDFTGLLFAAALIGLGNGISAGTMMTLGSDLAPPGSRGEFLGLWRLIGDAGATGAPLVVGWIAGLVFLQAAAGAIAGAGLIAAGIFAFFVPETLVKKKEKRQPVS